VLTLCALEPDGFAAFLDDAFRGKTGRAVRGHLRTSDSALFEGKAHPWRAAMVFYPQDGTSGEDLLQKLHRLLAQRRAA
jgi:hypothetical protein